eukprot:4677318-Amphidinium_carterae.1
MGGRLDSTNIVHPTACVITSVGLDHMAILGDTVEAIAREKGGIFKPGAHVVLGPETPELLDDMAMTIGAKSLVRLAPMEGEVYIALAQRIADAVIMKLGLASSVQVAPHQPAFQNERPPC